jgi:hypothetical protein
MAENIGSVFPTKIPEYAEDADIQEALRLYHYGSIVPPTNLDGVEVNSVAGHLKTINNKVTVLEGLGVGSDYSSTEPADPVNGFIWVNANTSANIVANTSVALLQNSAPTSGEVNLVSGLLWVDKDSSPLKMYVYDTSVPGWREIGA